MAVEEAYSKRFDGANWFNPDQKVCIGGLGSIGSWLLLFLSRMLHNIYTYEMDIVEGHNLSGQFFNKDQINETKFIALRDSISIYSPNCTLRNNGKFESDLPVLPISFSCFDSMKARREMFEQWKKLEDKEVFIDGRLTAENFWLYIVTPDKEDKYEEFLFSDDEVDDLPCSFRSTTHISSMLASYMTNAFTNYMSNKNDGDNTSILPFEIKYYAPLFLIEFDDGNTLSK